METNHRMPIAVLLLSTILTAAHYANADKLSTEPEPVSLLTQAQLLKILPSDADLKNIRRQQKAVKRGLYWTKSKTLRHLDQKG